MAGNKARRTTSASSGERTPSSGVRRLLVGSPLLGECHGSAGKLAHLLRVALAASRRVSEQKGRDRCSPPSYLVGRLSSEVQDQGLIELDIDVECVAQFIDPVVEVHTDRFAPSLPRTQTTRRMIFGQFGRVGWIPSRASRSAASSTSRDSTPTARTSVTRSPASNRWNGSPLAEAGAFSRSGAMR